MFCKRLWLSTIRGSNIEHRHILLYGRNKTICRLESPNILKRTDQNMSMETKGPKQILFWSLVSRGQLEVSTASPCKQLKRRKILVWQDSDCAGNDHNWKSRSEADLCKWRGHQMCKSQRTATIWNCEVKPQHAGGQHWHSWKAGTDQQTIRAEITGVERTRMKSSDRKQSQGSPLLRDLGDAERISAASIIVRLQITRRSELSNKKWGNEWKLRDSPKGLKNYQNMDGIFRGWFEPWNSTRLYLKGWYWLEPSLMTCESDQCRADSGRTQCFILIHKVL